MKEPIYFPSTEKWRAWLNRNHNKLDKISLLCYKKHTKKPTPSHKELMFEAICFGWIDTTVHRLDSDRYIRKFSKRNKNSTWSYNTLSYAKQLVKEKRMAPLGLKFYKEGLKKKPHDHGLPKNPKTPKELQTELNKNKIARENYKNLPKSAKRNYLRWLLRAKLPETKKKRIGIIVNSMKKGEKRGW